MYKGSSGIREIETDTFKLHCHQTLTGVKFVVVADRNQVIFFCCDFEERKNTAFFRFETVQILVPGDSNALFKAGVDQLLDKIYELYADFALKNPFYSLEMPIR